MEFRTIVNISSSSFAIEPCERMLFVGSCFADNIGQRFQQEKFRADVNPFGVMYNPLSVVHTIEKVRDNDYLTVVITLGTNHIYREKATGIVVDNCRKRPQNLFQEEVLSVDECYDALCKAVELMPDSRFIITVSPIRYRKYGYHESQLSKATLLLAADRLAKKYDHVEYFPAYEILNDELRDYRFYQPDMLHPSAQAVEYIYERFAQVYFSPSTEAFLAEWKPIREALGHRPFNPDSEEYRLFMAKTQEKINQLKTKYPMMDL